MNTNTFSTEEAASKIGCTSRALINWLSRNPDQRPTKRFGFNLVWTDQDVERVMMARQQTRLLAGNHTKQVYYEENI